MKIELCPLSLFTGQLRPANKIRYPILTILCFLGTFIVTQGSFWEDVATLSFILSLAFLALMSGSYFHENETTTTSQTYISFHAKQIIISEARAHLRPKLRLTRHPSRSPHECNQRRHQERHNPLSINSHS